MNKPSLRKIAIFTAALLVLLVPLLIVGLTYANGDENNVILPGTAEDPRKAITLNLPFQVPSFQRIIGTVLRLFFLVAGLAALFFLLLGAFEWVTSGGDEKKTEGARNKIQAAVIGLILIIVVLSIVALLEVVVFAGTICLGLTCDIQTKPLELVKPFCDADNKPPGCIPREKK
jgi:hypothetical protein